MLASTPDAPKMYKIIRVTHARVQRINRQRLDATPMAAEGSAEGAAEAESEGTDEDGAPSTAQQAAASALEGGGGGSTRPLAPAGECIVCLDGSNSHVLVPCGHKCVCGACAELIKTEGTCPMCRTNVVWVCEVFE